MKHDMGSLGDVMRMALGKKGDDMQCQKCGVFPAFPRVLCLECFESMQWQPIETAPELEYVLLALGDGIVTMGAFNPDLEKEFPARGWQALGPVGICVRSVNPTHWMALPAPPPKTASETPLEG